MDFLTNSMVDAAEQVLQEGIFLIHEHFPEDLLEQVEVSAKAAFSALNLEGGAITAETILARYKQQRCTHSC